MLPVNMTDDFRKKAKKNWVKIYIILINYPWGKDENIQYADI